MKKISNPVCFALLLTAVIGEYSLIALKPN